MKRFHFSFNKLAYAVYLVIALVTLGGGIYNLLRVIGIAKPATTMIATDITSVVVLFVLFALISIVVFASGYQFKNDCFVINMLFSRAKISKDRIACVCVNDKSGLIAVYYSDGNETIEPAFLVVCIRKAKVNDFLSAMSNFKPGVEIVYKSIKGE